VFACRGLHHRHLHGGRWRLRDGQSARIDADYRFAMPRTDCMSAASISVAKRSDIGETGSVPLPGRQLLGKCREGPYPKRDHVSVELALAAQAGIGAMGAGACRQSIEMFGYSFPARRISRYEQVLRERPNGYRQTHH
jgi:hypothetical protein